MRDLPPALAPLAAYRQWITYKLVARADGKTDKLPLSPGGAVADSQDPANWQTWAEAHATGRPVGFVFTEADPFWFVDLDNCLTDAGWSEDAVAICHALAGAAVEVSQSGRGLHLIGTGAVPPHSIQPTGRGLYTARRFVALTGTHASGSAGHDCTAAMLGVVARWFPPVAAVAPSEWTAEPCENYGGPVDDDELIARAMAARPSAAAAFGTRATFRQLWTADEAALGRAWPSEGRAYDASSADAALAQHLAYWTGRDCERVERLMRRSALAREKWDLRGDYYLRRTILRACGQQTDIPARAGADGRTDAGEPGTVEGGRTLVASDFAEHFAGCVYIEDRYAAAVPDGSILTPQQFRASGRYGGNVFMIDHTKSVRNAWEAFTESAHYRPAFAHSLCFRPELPARSIVQENGRLLFNSYTPVDVPSREGDAGPFLRHVAKLLPVERDRAILLAYMAACVQYPGVKFQWCPVIQGTEGNGKTALIDVVVNAVGERYSHTPNAQDLSNKFNGWIEGKLFIGIEELYVSHDKRDVAESLKVLVTNRRIEVQRKGADQVTADNRANFMATTNHLDAIAKSGNDRRYCVLHTAQQDAADLARDGMTGNYFPALYRWLREDGGFAIVTHYLRAYAIPDALNPAGAAHRAPETSSTAAAIHAGLGPIEQAILEAVATDETGFRGGWISSHYLGLLLERARFRAHPNQWDRLLQSIGYVRHPALPGGRLNNPVAPDNKKSRLWVKRDSIPALNLTTAVAAAAAYSTANSEFTAPIESQSTTQRL